MTPELLKRIIKDQQEEASVAKYIKRTAEESLLKFVKNKEIIVLTGVRRCGKSVLLHHLRKLNKESNYYFNFEDERLVTFTVSDFQLLQEVFIELFGLEKTFYFDEIQNIEGWELFVRRLYNGGNKIYITGSNATLFSEELGTRLTGRYIAQGIFPFSFYEYLGYRSPNIIDREIISTTDIGQIKKLLNEYCLQGGIPEYVKNKQIDYLHSLYESIIYRDIIARYKITNINSFKELVFYLASNCSKEITFNSLRKLLQLGSTTTVSDYCSYLEKSYLCFFVNRYDESVKAQMQSPKKVYFIDHVLAKIVGFRFSEDWGRIFENLVFIELKRRKFDIYYHKEKKECDFIARKNGIITHAIQVCHSFENAKTQEREIDGLLEALVRYNLSEGFILNNEKEEVINVTKNDNKYKIIMKPIWKWLLEI